MLTMTGTGIGRGIARGRAFIYTLEILRKSDDHLDGKEPVPKDESARMKSALQTVGQGLETDAEQIGNAMGASSGDIFRAQSALMHEPSVIDDLEVQLGRGAIDAEDAVRSVFAILARRFRDSPNEILRARGDDVEDLSRRLLLALRGIHAHRLEHIPPGTVVVARRLLPSDTVFLSRSSTVAILAEFAGPAAHAALLARELGIPCVSGLPTMMDDIRDGDDLIVDGDTGIAIISPDEATLDAYRDRLANHEHQRLLVEPIPNQHTRTLDGVAVVIAANARSRHDVEAAVRHGADGIGLFRTEPFFMASKHLPSAREFADFLIHCLEPMGDRYVNVRLLDIGADKMPTYLHLPLESDPFLGLRGVRVLLRYPQLLEEQVLALLTVAETCNIGVLIPMVATEHDVTRIVEVFHEQAAARGHSRVPPLGGMIETPASALTAGTLAAHLDFLSIGSNDLTQYTLAAGRENPSVIDYFIDDHPAVLRLMGMTIAEAGIPVSLCGELAGKVSAIPALLAMGLRSFSVAASRIADVRRAVSAARST